MNKERYFVADKELSGKTKLRRYLNLPKYLDLLRTHEMYFCLVNHFQDKFEGALTPIIRNAINEAYSKGEIEYNAEHYAKEAREGVYLSCWTMGSHENMALWNLYSNVSTGIAITSNMDNIMKAGREWTATEKVFLYKVQYIDHYTNPDITLFSPIELLRYKHSAYSFENEFRIVVDRINRNISVKPKSIKLKVELNDLIEEVTVGPEAEEWFFDLVSDVSQRYGLNIKVRRSKLTFIP